MTNPFDKSLKFHSNRKYIVPGLDTWTFVIVYPFISDQSDSWFSYYSEVFQSSHS